MSTSPDDATDDATTSAPDGAPPSGADGTTASTPHDATPRDATPHGATDDDADEHGAGVPAAGRPGQPVPVGGTALRHGAAPTQPPRRRGVFVDVDELRSHVGDLLRAMLGGYRVDQFGNMTFEHEGARVYVTVGPGALGPQVGVFSITNVDVELTAELGAFLLTNNHRLTFGAFSYDAENRAVWLKHALLGGTLDGPELRGAVLSIANLAARAGDVVAERFGGRPFADASADTQEAARPPEPSEEDDTDVVNASGYL